ncbi:uncharacterized protein LOC133733397 [Rosa rugosa]|uniref:uncharacterized protein LOC133733397 n=1 Tax=Rosa rugosa TaxID=74645 RepID=UPI002B41695F|nr:uncharacterized protein LOC133733397 [Rosa rugosa]
MTKNVAEEIAEKLCESVAASLEGKKLGSFTRISSTVQGAMEEALVCILTPRRSIDILRDVHADKEQGKPYVVVFVGVNGVGKSTNLSKVAYWLQQHQVSVMMAACDTFRSGAVEQLRTHARRLQIPISEKGYEKDPAVVAKEAIQEAKLNGSDVVWDATAADPKLLAFLKSYRNFVHIESGLHKNLFPFLIFLLGGSQAASLNLVADYDSLFQLVLKIASFTYHFRSPFVYMIWR